MSVEKQDLTSSSLFEISVSAVIFAPIVYFIFSYFFGQSFGLFASLLIPLSLIVVLYRFSFPKITFKQFINRSEIETFVFLTISFSFFLWACLQWPDFIAMGERLRDYALLSSVSESPIVAREPWMVGENLNYYLYWYRFAAYWSSIFGVSVWNTYHFLAAFSFAIFSSVIFRLMRRYLQLPLSAAALLAILIVVGSNLAGVINAFSDSSDWWGPSRVIKGTINEFPAWSFLLGDLHPHFLNLALTPFILCIALALINLSVNWGSKLSLILLVFLVTAPLQYNSNAWEVPMAGISFIIILLLATYAFRYEIKSNFKQFPKLVLIGLKDTKVLAITISLVICFISLILSSKNIKPADYPWRWVKPPIAASSLKELLLHWGIPFITILIALAMKIRTESITSISCSILFAFSIATQNSVYLLGSMILWILVEAISEIKNSKKNHEKIRAILLYGLGLSSLVLITIGELVFLDDPYGGENERMNTVFKIYSATWAPIHLFAFCLMYYSLISYQMRKLVILGGVVLSATLPAFFLHTIELRKNREPSMEGLASIEQQFRGSADAIRFLRTQDRKTVLESQGNPYSYTTHVATLGNQDSYLGWANHVGLLTGNHGEVNRREKISDQIYREENCDSKQEIALKEKIDLIVIGALEIQKYGSNVADNFSCFPVVFKDSGYQLLATGNINKNK